MIIVLAYFAVVAQTARWPQGIIKSVWKSFENNGREKELDELNHLFWGLNAGDVRYTDLTIKTGTSPTSCIMIHPRQGQVDWDPVKESDFGVRKFARYWRKVHWDVHVLHKNPKGAVACPIHTLHLHLPDLLRQ